MLTMKSNASFCSVEKKRAFARRLIKPETTFFHLGKGDAVYSINLFLLVALLTLNNVEEADSSLALLLMRQLSLSCLGRVKGRESKASHLLSKQTPSVLAKL